ncbi:MAG: hypothetical protein AB8G18_00440 [Gammaproteobacteria bacterium]
MPSSENFDPNRISDNPSELYGIKATLRPHDGFAALVGADWETVRWYATAEERDRVMATIATRHEFSRIGDEPAVNYTSVQRAAPGK